MVIVVRQTGQRAPRSFTLLLLSLLLQNHACPSIPTWNYLQDKLHSHRRRWLLHLPLQIPARRTLSMSSSSIGCHHPHLSCRCLQQLAMSLRSVSADAITNRTQERSPTVRTVVEPRQARFDPYFVQDVLNLSANCCNRL